MTGKFAKRDSQAAEQVKRCSWTTEGRRCCLPGTIETEGRPWCLWHYDSRNKSASRMDKLVFEAWVQGQNDFYGWNNHSVWSLHSVDSLWRAVCGYSADLKVVEPGDAVTLMDEETFGDTAIADYRALWASISAGAETPQSWREKLNGLNRDYGVNMTVPSLFKGVNIGRTAYTSAHHKTAAEMEAEAREHGIL